MHHGRRSVGDGDVNDGVYWLSRPLRAGVTVTITSVICGSRVTGRR